MRRHGRINKPPQQSLPIVRLSLGTNIPKIPIALFQHSPSEDMGRVDDRVETYRLRSDDLKNYLQTLFPNQAISVKVSAPYFLEHDGSGCGENQPTFDDGGNARGVET